LTLADLTRAESATLAELTLEEGARDQTAVTLDDGLAERLHSHTSGNPFFIQEVVTELIETGQIARRQDHWVTVGETATWGIPRGVRAVIDRRLRRLPRAAQRL